ncbi:protein STRICTOSIDINE SYNTHASE-LIKE 10-like [Chenopodium quinoa]|uniref:Strictosidine synthase conserved region domain-containing protein n=1 Tax=Chenopodium quinoa TaxID=63459 RepID=A0A803N5G1_CHEQI|nr:protein STRICTOSIDINE SYNTHASE-LIKE 10-like [Chenopodium quinoa]
MKPIKFLTSSTIVLLCALLLTTYFRSKNKSYPGSKFSELEFLPIEDAFGPESLTFDPAGDGPYAGLSDGRIIKWDPHQRRWVDFAFTSPLREFCKNQTRTNHEKMEHKCGRPLGLRFNEKTGELFIADAYLGLLVVGPNGGLASRVVTEVEGVPLGFTNGLDIDQSTGAVYFTSSSTNYPRRKYMSLILSNDKTGRLLKYNPLTKQVTKLLDNLTFPNGVSLSKNGKFLLLIETTTCKLLRHWLENSPKAGTTEVLAELPGYPDNINRNSKGDYWVGVYSKRSKVLKWLLSFPWIGQTIVKLPFNAVELAKVFVRLRAIGLAVKMDENGNVVQVLEDTSGKLKFVSEVVEKDGNLWFGSVILPFASLYKNYDAQS